MKRVILAFIHLVFLLGSSMAQTEQGPKNGAIISFPISSHDFGDIVQGEKVQYIFKFKNTGTEPLIISEVLTTCGCTATQWNKTAILPGKEGEIVATFDSANKMGRQNKVITVLSNATNNPGRVSIVCNVLPPKTETTPSTETK